MIGSAMVAMSRTSCADPGIIPVDLRGRGQVNVVAPVGSRSANPVSVEFPVAPGGVVSTAATRLGLPRTTLNAMMRKLGISRKDL